MRRGGATSETGGTPRGGNRMTEDIPYSEQAEKWTLSEFMKDEALLAAHPLDP